MVVDKEIVSCPEAKRKAGMAGRVMGVVAMPTLCQLPVRHMQCHGALDRVVVHEEGEKVLRWLPLAGHPWRNAQKLAGLCLQRLDVCKASNN